MSIKITESVVREKVDGVKTYIFVGMVFLMHLLYFMVFLGVTVVDYSYIRVFSACIQLFVCVFLAIRFHPFRRYSISKFDAMIIFSSSSLLFTNVVATELLSYFSKDFGNMGSYEPGIITKLKSMTGITK
jgi:hypothetical protein